MNKYILGLDVGIASVGWAIVEKDTYSIIDSGVRLFQEGTAEDNAARRTKRGTRRLTRRRKQRLEDFIQLSKDFNIIVKPTFLSDPLSLRIKGLTEKLTNDEIFTALYHIIKYRGTSLETVSESDEEKGTKGILNANEKLLSKYQYVCLVQKYRLDSNMQYRGNENTFKTENYVQEAVKILSNQDVPEAYKQKVIDLIKRRRHFSEGPGSEKSPTPYGRYFINDKNEIEFIDLIEKMRGRCSVFNNELRAPKNAPSVELFNFLNDLNNMNVENKKITQNQKNLIINNFIINGKQGITVKQLAKFLEIDENEISGLREDASNKKLTWKSDKTEIATVDDNGKVTALKAGTATITVTTEDGGKTATCQLTVTAKTIAVESVALNKSELTLVEDETETLSATVLPENASNKKLTW